MDTKIATIVGAIAAAGAAALFIASAPDAPGLPCRAVEVLAPAALAEQAGLAPASDPELVPLLVLGEAALPGPRTPADEELNASACEGMEPNSFRVRPAAAAWPACVAGEVTWTPTGADYEQPPTLVDGFGRCCQPGCACASERCGPVPPAEIGPQDRHRECLYAPDPTRCPAPPGPEHP